MLRPDGEAEAEGTVWSETTLVQGVGSPAPRGGRGEFF